MAKNDNMDALVGLGILGAMLEASAKDDFERVKKMTESGRSSIPRQENKVTPADGAKAAKEIFDSYVAAGFNEVQAFELLKLVLTQR